MGGGGVFVVGILAMLAILFSLIFRTRRGHIREDGVERFDVPLSTGLRAEWLGTVNNFYVGGLTVSNICSASYYRYRMYSAKSVSTWITAAPGRGFGELMSQSCSSTVIKLEACITGDGNRVRRTRLRAASWVVSKSSLCLFSHLKHQQSHLSLLGPVRPATAFLLAGAPSLPITINSPPHHQPS